MADSTQVKFRGGTTAENAAMVPVEKEMVIDKTKKVVAVGDGVQAGGHEMLGANMANYDGTRLTVTLNGAALDLTGAASIGGLLTALAGLAVTGDISAVSNVTVTGTDSDSPTVTLQAGPTAAGGFLRPAINLYDETGVNGNRVQNLADGSDLLQFQRVVAGTPTTIMAMSAAGLAVTGDITAAGSVAVTDFLRLPNKGELTIATGVITATGSQHFVDTEADAATDDLATINGGTSGDILILRSANNSRDTTVKDGSGNLRIAGDFTLTNSQDTIELLFDGSNWIELSRSDNS